MLGGNDDLAIQHHELALNERKKDEASNQILIADSYINIGLVYARDVPGAAVGQYNQALSIYKKE